ncbi:unnamed protein product, partial [Rotaria sordida]
IPSSSTTQHPILNVLHVLRVVNSQFSSNRLKSSHKLKNFNSIVYEGGTGQTTIAIVTIDRALDTVTADRLGIIIIIDVYYDGGTGECITIAIIVNTGPALFIIDVSRVKIDIIIGRPSRSFIFVQHYIHIYYD